MKLALPFLITLVLYVESFAQGFVGRTNEVSVDFNAPPIVSALPQITWITPQLESSFSEQNILSVEANVNSDVAINTISLAVYRIDQSSTKKIPVEAEVYSKRLKLDNVMLLDGENTVEITVENLNGAKVSSKRSVLVGKNNASLLSANRKDIALIFAIDKYDHWDDLVNPINDARTIEAVLKEKYNFQTEVIENATYEEILVKLTDYNTKKFNVQDQLFIFFAGHGSFDEVLGEGYIVASNSLRSDKGKTTYLPHTVLRQRIDNIKCEHIFLAMDVCFGGTIDPVLASTRAVDEYAEATDVDYLVRKLSKRTRKFLTSGSKEYVSDGIPGKHSPFASKFVQALKTIGDGKDRILTLTELQTYFLKLPTEPRFGGFGSDDKASDFVFVAKGD